MNEKKAPEESASEHDASEEHVYKLPAEIGAALQSGRTVLLSIATQRALSGELKIEDPEMLADMIRLIRDLVDDKLLLKAKIDELEEICGGAILEAVSIRSKTDTLLKTLRKQLG